MKKQFIKDLKVGDKVQTFFVAKHKQLEFFRDKSKGRFLTVVLADRSGRIVGRAWENGPALYDQFEENDIIAVLGRVDEYLGRPQIIVQKLRPARPEDKDVHYSEDDFVPQTDKDVDQLWATVTGAAEGVAHPQLKALLQRILGDEQTAAALRAAPATKAMHHSYRGGLLEHIVEMLTLSHSLLTLYPQLDRDLFTTGIIVHDLGSLQGQHYERDIDYSDAGRLVGHIVLGDRLVAEHIAAIPNFPTELAMAISHMILSHHGETEHGTVREPLTLEATALYLLNKLSAELNHVQQVFDSQWDVEKPWTDFDPMTRRYFFRGRVREAAPVPESPPTSYPPVEESTTGDLPSLADKPAKSAQTKK